jgi:hypothetical protein
MSMKFEGEGVTNQFLNVRLMFSRDTLDDERWCGEVPELRKFVGYEMLDMTRTWACDCMVLSWA